MAALTGLLANSDLSDSPEKFAEGSYKVADAMMKERSQEGGDGK